MIEPLIDRATFVRYVEDALGRLHLPAGLEGHPLGALLTVSGKPLSGAGLARHLIDAIQELRPYETGSYRPAHWRLYRHLLLRYVEALHPTEVARQLGVSVRQGRRDHQQALAALIAVLWARYANEHQVSTTPSPVPETDLDTALDEEIARIGAASPRAPVMLGPALRGAIDTVGPLAESRGITIETHLAPNLRPLFIGETALRQILLSLLSFGCEQAPAGCLRLTADDVRDEIAISLSIGPHATEGLTLADPRTADVERVQPLRIARRLAELQGGSVEIASREPGTLQVLLRFKAFYSATVLVIDDNPDFVRLFRRYLSGSPYRVVEAKIPAQATHVAVEVRPDVITLDVMMASPDGWQILQQLKRRPETQHIPVVICSVLRENALALALGASACLAKPITQQALLGCLATCVGLVPEGSLAGSQSPRRSIDRQAG